MLNTVGILIFVTKKRPKPQLLMQNIELVSKKLDGIPTDVIEIPAGFKPRVVDDARYRPFSGGVAMINYLTQGTGTLGVIVKRLVTSSKLYGLTNNHVGANEDVEGLVPPAAKIGQHWIQPGIHGGGKVPNDVIARLYKWNRIKPRAPNQVNYYDAAVGEITAKSLPQAQAYQVKDIGTIKGIENTKLGDKVLKRGRTTRKTVGMVSGFILPPSIISVEYRGYSCDFTDQIMIVGQPCRSPFSQPGDSGSLVVSASSTNGTYKAKALLFAGGRSSDGIDYTIASPIKRVAKDFGLKF